MNTGMHPDRTTSVKRLLDAVSPRGIRKDLLFHMCAMRGQKTGDLAINKPVYCKMLLHAHLELEAGASWPDCSCVA